jgi:predicted RNase H-like nuclease (RuvC/YqgF family)
LRLENEQRQGNSIVYSGRNCPLCIAEKQNDYNNELIQSIQERNRELLNIIEKLNKSISNLMEEINQLKKED